MTKKYRTISLFSGAMGLDLGIESTGRFDLLACVEKEAPFCETIRLNKAAGRLPEKLHIYQGDICEIDPVQVMADCGLRPGDLDLLIGGPPCQSYSTAGKRGTVQDPRGMLIWQFLKFVEVLQPKFFVMENVRGLISAALKHRPIAKRPEKGGKPLCEDEEPGSVIRLFARDLQRCGSAAYHMDCFEVNAVNYGAPQLRERVVFIGNRFNKRVDFPNPTHGQSDPALKPWRTLRDAIGGLNDPGSVVMDFSPRKKSYLRLVPEGSNWRSMPILIQQESMGRAWHAKGGRSGWWRRLSFDLPCPTLVTMPNHASTSLCHPTEVRALSLKEYALIQEFPSDWEFSGTPAQQYAQVGNAVPVRLGRVAGEVVAQALDDLKRRKWKPEPGEIEEYRIVYVQSHVRTRQWFKNGETKVWSDGDLNKAVRYASPVTLRSERKMAGV
ncbi:cytosine-specific methyltransferase [Thalassobaculum fulvum]|uniref:Cytosine-specific methyltransferase n=1 Tax=Thalassobaculum fulvum TaxID=1633335 RepID=A0A918XRA7_9PROT|nr:DNA cytosine methyltransferase [Thalassobaculum fulvum]GHD46508.1 cytosine-specific methyltransferase [Thalassobaculum fulvum]